MVGQVLQSPSWCGHPWEYQVGTLASQQPRGCQKAYNKPNYSQVCEFHQLSSLFCSWWSAPNTHASIAIQEDKAGCLHDEAQLQFLRFFAPSTTIACPPQGAYLCKDVKSRFWDHRCQGTLVPLAWHGSQLGSRATLQCTASPPPHAALSGADPTVYFGLLMKIFSAQSPPRHTSLTENLAQCSVSQQDTDIWKKRSLIYTTSLQSC